MLEHRYNAYFVHRQCVWCETTIKEHGAIVVDHNSQNQRSLLGLSFTNTMHPPTNCDHKQIAQAVTVDTCLRNCSNVLNLFSRCIVENCNATNATKKCNPPLHNAVNCTQLCSSYAPCSIYGATMHLCCSHVAVMHLCNTFVATTQQLHSYVAATQ